MLLNIASELENPLFKTFWLNICPRRIILISFFKLFYGKVLIFISDIYKKLKMSLLCSPDGSRGWPSEKKKGKLKEQTNEEFIDKLNHLFEQNDHKNNRKQAFIKM